MINKGSQQDANGGRAGHVMPIGIREAGETGNIPGGRLMSFEILLKPGGTGSMAGFSQCSPSQPVEIYDH